MKKWLKRIRAAIGIGLAWAVAWFGAGMLLLLVVGFGAADVPFPLGFGLLGFLAGTTFSTILGILGRRRRFDEMSLPHFAGWGALGGVLVCGIVLGATGAGADLLVAGPVFALAGAISAAGTLGLARQAEQPTLPGSGGEAAELERETDELRSRNQGD